MVSALLLLAKIVGRQATVHCSRGTALEKEGKSSLQKIVSGHSMQEVSDDCPTSNIISLPSTKHSQEIIGKHSAQNAVNTLLLMATF